MSKSPYEIRLDLITEARLILQAQAEDHASMPNTEAVLEEARKLNDFVSESQPRPPRKDRY